MAHVLVVYDYSDQLEPSALPSKEEEEGVFSEKDVDRCFCNDIKICRADTCRTFQQEKASSYGK